SVCEPSPPRRGPTGLAMLGALHRDDPRARRCRLETAPFASRPGVRLRGPRSRAPRRQRATHLSLVEPRVKGAAVLSVDPAAGLLRYRLDVPDPGGPLQEEFRHPLDEGTLEALRQSADGLLRSAESLAFAREARERGVILYRTLVPVRLRAQ